jgi:CheY-like chemotaxis protein
MPIIQTRLLIVDDEPAIRTSMSLALKEIGYEVRAAEDGFSALAEFRKEIPDVLVSDLSMPGMSGFELLSVVRRRFPMMNTVAMSGAFCGDEVPSGVAAHAFYQKGSSTGSLLKILRGFPQTERSLFRQPGFRATDETVPEHLLCRSPARSVCALFRSFTTAVRDSRSAIRIAPIVAARFDSLS